jgi:hypothetical protein
MRLAATVALTALMVPACGSTTYQIPNTELARLATLPPETRGQHVRVVEQLHDTYVGEEQPVTVDTQIVLFPQVGVSGPERRRYTAGGGNVTIGGGHVTGSPPRPGSGAHGGGGGGLHMGGSGGGGKGEAIALLAAAAVILVVAAAVEGSRYDGYAQVHPMQMVHLFGRDGGYAALPLAWIDPQTAAWTDHALLRENEGPWQPLGRAALDRAGWTYALFGGVGTYKSIDGTKALGTATTIQLGYFPSQTVGVLASIFLGWRDDTYGDTLFESRYTLELDDYVGHAGPVHFGFYAGGGGAYRWEDAPGMPGAGDAGSLALLGGALVQLDINTRLALTARLGATYAHSEGMADALIGLAVY